MATLSYPGVYVDEIPSGVRPITGVATSITAFIGRALRGPVDQAITITAYGDFERIYGGLWIESSLGYAVRDFYRNGGGVAIIVRVHTTAANDTASLTIGAGARAVSLVAASPGLWGSKLTATIDNLTSNAADTTLFNLTVTDTGTGKIESFRNVSFAPLATRRVDLVLANESTLVRFNGSLPTQPQSSFPASANAANGNNGGAVAAAVYTTGANLRTNKRGLYALENADLVNLIVIPPYTSTGEVEPQVLTDTIAYAEERRAVMIMDPPAAWVSVDAAVTGASAASFTSSKNAAVYFPRINEPDSLRDGQVATFAPSGAIAGTIARTDATRGVWKAPAGLDATIGGVDALSVALTDLEIGRLNPLGVNCLRASPGAGHTIWGARTRAGSDRLASEWKYLPVRRMALFLEESLFRGTEWVVFEPNDAPLWAQIRLNITSFMNVLFRQGAFAGTTPKEAFFVKCDAESTTQDDVNLGIVNIIVGFAPLKPAEFVVIKLQQMAGQEGGRMMPQFSVNTHRLDPYKNFKFRVKWDGRYVAGISKVGALKKTTEVVEHREGGDPSTSHKSPGRTKYEAITLERGVTHDTEFESWANKVWNFGSGLGAEVSLKDFRKDVLIDVYNEAGQLVLSYKVYRAWVSEYQALPDLDANANAVAIQTMKLEHEGWERDYEVPEPSEPTFTEP